MDDLLIDPSPERQEIDFRPLGIDAVVVLGKYEYHRVHPPLEAHRHGGMIEICLLASGRQSYLVDGRPYHLSGGDVFITYPGEQHGSGSEPEEQGTLYWMLLRVPRGKQRFLCLPPVQWRPIFDRFLSGRPRQFRGNTNLKRILDRILAVAGQADDPLRVVNLQNLITRFLLDTLVCARSQSRVGPSPPLLRILAHIDANRESELTLPALAAMAHLSLSRFKARFKNEVGLPPADYIMRGKIERARQLLAGGDLSVTQIAMRLGFSSTQYFATAFKRHTGKTPSQARRADDA